MRLQRTERQTRPPLEETSVVLEDVLEETEVVTVVEEEEVAREVDEDVQDPGGTRTSKDQHPHPGSLTQQAVVDATMTPPLPPWRQGMVHRWVVTRAEDEMPES